MAAAALAGLKGPLVYYARALVNAKKWQIFPVRQIIHGEWLGAPTMKCDCNNPGCTDIGKHPRVRWTMEASNDERRVTELWVKYPNDGIGLATGEKSAVWVLDVDPRSGGVASLAALELANGPLPVTITANTGSGGVHYYFKYPGPEYRNTAGALGAGLDTRGDGGYVVLPPSAHKSGKRYSWKTSCGPAEAELAEAPAWLLKMVKTRKPPATLNSQKKKLGLHTAPTPRSEARVLLEDMLKHPLIRWMREYPDDVDRETWRGVAQNLVCAVSDHEDLIEEAAAAFHEVSEDYSGYAWGNAERTFRDAVESAVTMGPMTFAHMVASGMPSEHVSPGATCLVHAARLGLRKPRGSV